MISIKSLFNDISANYDFLNNLISLGTHIHVKKYAIRNLFIKPNSKVLDLCCGTGDLGKIIHNEKKNIKIIGVDFSSKMLEVAKRKNPSIEYLQANATNIPFENDSFDYVVMGFGLRNIPDRELAIKEIRRVLKPDGQLLHIDFGKHNFCNKIHDLIITLMAKLFSKNFEAYKYLITSKNNFPEPQELIREFEQQKFVITKYKNLLFGIISFQIFSIR